MEKRFKANDDVRIFVRAVLALSAMEDKVNRLESRITALEVANVEKPRARAKVRGRQVRCPGCGHVWTYKGQAVLPTCPSCHNKVRRSG